MVQAGSVILVVVAALSATFKTTIKPALDIVGVFRSPTNLNNERCTPVPELQGCEDMWLDRDSGLAYLPCTPPQSRTYWQPALLKFDRLKIPFPSEDYIALFDTNSRSFRKVKLTGLPPHIKKEGLHLHAIDLYVHPGSKKATILVNNHRPPKNVENAHEEGADSVIEFFETTLGSDEASHVGTVKHPLIYTPNNLVAISPRTFYFTNDHSEKTHWASAARHYEILFERPGADIIYCSMESGFSSPHCIKAAGSFPHPNGIAKGPANTLWSVTTFKPTLRSFEIQADNTLVLLDEVKIPRAIDNIHVSSSGAVYLAAIPKLLDFVATVAEKNIDRHAEMKVPAEVWRVSNGTGVESYHGGRLVVEKVFADDGTKVSLANTNVVPYNNKLYLTGLTSYHLTICDVAPEFAK